MKLKLTLLIEDTLRKNVFLRKISIKVKYTLQSDYKLMQLAQPIKIYLLSQIDMVICNLVTKQTYI